MKVTVYKYILRDLSTMKKVGHTYAEHGKDPVAPPGMFVSKCVGSSIKHYAEPIVEVCQR